MNIVLALMCILIGYIIGYRYGEKVIMRHLSMQEKQSKLLLTKILLGEEDHDGT